VDDGLLASVGLLLAAPAAEGRRRGPGRATTGKRSAASESDGTRWQRISRTSHAAGYSVVRVDMEAFVLLAVVAL
jgi:hypothetical protein